MKILFTRFPLESSFGGAEVQTIALMKGLLARGHAVMFLGSCPTLLRLCREEGIPSAELRIGAPPVTKWGALSFLWRRRNMRTALARALGELSDIDAICMLSLTEKLLLTESAAAQGKRVFWIEHDGIGRWLTKNPWLPQLRKLSKSATVVVVSDLSKRLTEALGFATVVSIPNGIDAARFPSDAHAQRDAKDFRIGTVARLTEDKGVDVLIDAVSALPQVSLTIVGRGREEGFLRGILIERALTDRVTLSRSVADLGAFYRSLDVFVLPSRTHDPFGLVAAEAMVCGTATIVTDACGIAAHIAAGTEAIVVPSDSTSALREAIEGLFFKERRTAIAHAGKCAALERFSLENMVIAYEKLLRE